MKINITWIAACMLAYTTSTQAQTIRGTVTDAISGETLPGALIKLTGTDKGAVADADGRYTINELICLSNMENINAVLINEGIPQGERLVKLNQIAIQQMQVLEGDEERKLLK